jgi:hypothetical protein
MPGLLFRCFCHKNYRTTFYFFNTLTLLYLTIHIFLMIYELGFACDAEHLHIRFQGVFELYIAGGSARLLSTLYVGKLESSAGVWFGPHITVKAVCKRFLPTYKCKLAINSVAATVAIGPAAH